MTDNLSNSLSDTEIVKAIEYCSKQESDKYCKKCPIYKQCNEDPCYEEKLSLDLINRLQAENERLKEPTLEFLGHKDPVGEKGDCGRAKNCHHIATAKAESYKEFAERLREKRFDLLDNNEDIFYAVDVADIDNLLKELVGEDK